MDIQKAYFEFLAGLSLTFPSAEFSVHMIDDDLIDVRINKIHMGFSRKKLMSDMQSQLSTNPDMALRLSESLKGVDLDGTLTNIRND